MRVRRISGVAVAIVLILACALTATSVAAANMVANVTGGGIQFDGTGFYPGELVQINGIRYDGSTIPYGPATANAAGSITGVVPYSDTALYQIDARGYASGMHAVSNITGALPYPVVPPGYPYVTQVLPDYAVGVPGNLPINGGYANTGYPFTGSPYGGFSPGPGFNYPVPPSGVILYPYWPGYAGAAGAPTFVAGVGTAGIGVSVPFSGGGWAPGAPVNVWWAGTNGATSVPTQIVAGSDGSLTDALSFPSAGTWRVFAQASGMANPVAAVVQVTG